MYCLPAGQEKELDELLLEDELALLLEEVDVLVLVDVEDDASNEDLLEELLLKDDVAVLAGMQPTTSNETTTETSNIFFLIIKQLFDLF